MPNATQLLRQDHKKVESLFNKFKQGNAISAKRRVAEQAMYELEVHAQVEEEIFYPVVKKENASDLVDQAKQEHKKAKTLIALVRKANVDSNAEGGDFEAKFADLIEAIGHHVEEEEGEMFPEVEDSKLDLAALGAQMAKRKQEIIKAKGRENTKLKAKVGSKAKLNSTRQSQTRGSVKRSSRAKGNQRANTRNK